MVLVAACHAAPLASRAAEVPQSVSELWSDFDPRKEDLQVELVREWKADGMVLRSVRFLVGTFKGRPARLAAFDESFLMLAALCVLAMAAAWQLRGANTP